MTNESPPPDPAAPEGAAPPTAVASEAPPERPSEGGSADRRDDRGDRGDRRDRDDRGDSDDRPRRGGGGGGFRRRGCEFCIGHTNVLDYKDVERVRRYIGERGKMEARRKVGTCAKHQRVVARAVKRARHMALLPYTAEHIRVSGVPGGGGRR